MPHRFLLPVFLAFVVSCFIAPAQASGFKDCLGNFPTRPPTIHAPAAWKFRELCFDGFAVLHSGRTHTPIFAVERLTRARLLDARDEKRTNRFFADARLPRAERAELEDYEGSGYDRGHMAPAADMPNDRAMAQSFSLANMVPQAPTNNRRTWAKLEHDTRKYVMRSGSTVYVFSGPVWKGKVKRIGARYIPVPTHLYKLVYDATRNRAWAYWLANTDKARAGRPISYAVLTQRLGVKLLGGLHPKS